MPAPALLAAPARILVVQPSWVGDAVMATPALRALRQLYPRAQITYLCRRYVKPLFTACPLADRVLSHRPKTSLWKLAARLRRARFDMALLLPNSFRTAFLCRLAGIPRLVGYDRDGRGLLLTHKLRPERDALGYRPSPIIHAYLKLVHLLGSQHGDLRMQLGVTPAEQRLGEEVLQRAALKEGEGRPWIVLNPGAQYGSAKCWRAEHFAALGDQLIERGASVLITAAPREREIVQSILFRMKRMPYDLSDKGMTLGALKHVLGRCDLLITNDTGPRHIAAAMGVPVITLFGPTFPQWTEIYYERERQLRVEVPCGPCQLKVCPLDHRCMVLLTPAMVLRAVADLLPQWAPAST